MKIVFVCIRLLSILKLSNFELYKKIDATELNKRIFSTFKYIFNGEGQEIDCHELFINAKFNMNLVKDAIDDYKDKENIINTLKTLEEDLSALYKDGAEDALHYISAKYLKSVDNFRTVLRQFEKS